MKAMNGRKFSDGLSFGVMIFCLWLLVNAKAESPNKMIPHWPVPTLHHQLAPETIDGNLYTAAYYNDFSTTELPRKFQVEILTYDTRPGIPYKLCQFPVTARWYTTELNIGTLRQISSDIVVFTWYENPEDDFRITRVVALNMNDCHQYYLQHDVVSKPIVVPTTSGKFDLYVSENYKICKNSYTCRISYDMNDIKKSQIYPFTIDLDWRTIRISRLSNGNVVASGLTKKTFKFILIDNETDEKHILKELPDRGPNFEYVFTDLSLCWMDDVVNGREAHCEQYSEDKKLIFNNSVKYEEAVTLIDVHPLKNNGYTSDEVLLTAKKANCQNERDCWKILLTKLRPSHDSDGVELVKYTALTSDFKDCIGDAKQLIVFKAENRPAPHYDALIHFACKTRYENREGHLFHSYSAKI